MNWNWFKPKPSHQPPESTGRFVLKGILEPRPDWEKPSMTQMADMQNRIDAGEEVDVQAELTQSKLRGMMLHVTARDQNGASITATYSRATKGNGILHGITEV